MKLSRRGLIAGAMAALAAPAIIRTPGLLMPIKSQEAPLTLGSWVEVSPNGLLTINEITRESVRLWRNQNYFLRVRTPFPAAREPLRINSTLRISLPNDFLTSST